MSGIFMAQWYWPPTLAPPAAAVTAPDQGCRRPLALTSASRPAEDGARACRSAPMLTRELATAPNNLAAFWMPVTATSASTGNPRLIAGAAAVHYTMLDGRRIIDSAAGLWCCNAGH